MKALHQAANKYSPCKSHSPDFANRNSIKNTTILIQDIRYKLKKAEQKQLRFEIESSISQAQSDPSNIQSKYKQLYNQYLRMKNQHKTLSQQNKLLNQENQRLYLLQSKNKSINKLNSILINQKQYDQLKQKMKVEIQEKIHIQKQLQMQKKRNQQFLKNIQILRKQKLSLTQYITLQLKKNSGSKNIPNFETNQLKQQNLLSLWDEMVKAQQFKMMRILDDINRRIMKAEMNQKIIVQKYSRIQSDKGLNPASNKVETYYTQSANSKYDTNYKPKINPYQKPVIQSTSSPRSYIKSINNESPINSSSPIQFQNKLEQSLQHLQNQNYNLRQDLKQQQSEIQKLKIQRQKLSRKCNDLQKQKKPNVSTPKFNQNIDKSFNKIEPSLIPESIQAIKNDNINLKAQIQHISQIFARQKQQYTIKIHTLEQQMNKLQQKSKKQSFQYGLKDKQILLLRQQIQQLYKKQQKSINQYSQKQIYKQQQLKKVKQINVSLSQELKDYMQMLEYIRSKIQVNEIKSILDQNSTIYSQCQKTLIEQREIYNQTIYSVNNQLLRKQEQIIAFQHEIALKNKEIQLLNQELINIKKINKELQTNNMNFLKSNKEKYNYKSDIIKSNTKIIIEKLQSGEEKLDILYQKINNCVNFDVPNE